MYFVIVQSCVPSIIFVFVFSAKMYGVRVCNIEARIYDYTETVFIDTSGTAMTARAEHGCGGDYGSVSGAVGVSVAEIVAMQPVMMCERAGWDGVSDGVMGTTVVLPLQSENRVCSTWEQGEKALLECYNAAQDCKNSECKQGQP